MPQFDTAQVRAYYDRHTSEFVSLGQGGDLGAIHRAVWGPGTHSREDAFRYVEDQIAEHLSRLAAQEGSVPQHVIDLGCGVGSSLCALAERGDIRGTGITLSPVQARLAQRRISEAGLSDRLRCIEADYTKIPDYCETADLAYAIESFVHGPDPERFFAQCAHIIRPGGLLVICDDFRRPVNDPIAERTVEQFCRGWHINSLLPPSELRTLAQQAGFDHDSTADLTAYLELGRPRDKAIALLVGLFGWIPAISNRFDHLLGGNALQTCLAHRWIGYELAVFRRLG